MDEKIPNDVNEPQAPDATPVAPAAESEDAQQFSKWMAEYGRPALIGLAVAVFVLLGLQIWRNQKASKAEAAVQALFQNRSAEELQQLAVADPQAPTAPMALASAAAEFYAQGRYDEALAAYQSFLGQYPGHMLVPEATVGVAASHEALDNFEQAAADYQAFAQAHADHPLRPQATFGAARCLEQLGQFAEARAIYEDFIAANPDSPALPQAESGLLFLKKAERAKDLPAPAVAPAVAEETPAEEAVAPVVEEPAVAEAAPAVAEEKAAQDPPKKKKSSKKKKPANPPAEAEAGEPAAE